jgi:tetratricopeptide (TPR) repeat protein
MANLPELDVRITKCEKILDSDPNSQIFAALADAYRKKGDLEKSFRICQNGLRIHPSYGSAHVVMAKINLDRGLYDWAEIEADKAVEIDGRTRSIELLLAEIYIYKGEFNAAIKLLKKLHEDDPDHAQIKKLLEIACKLPEEQAALSGGSVVDDEPEQNGGGVTAEIAMEQETDRISAQELVERSVAIPGIDGVLFLNFEGLVVESEWSLEMDRSTCAATLGAIGNVVDQRLIRNSFGDLRTVLIETEELTFYLVRVADGVFLFAAKSSANLGTLRMRIENLLVKYQ